MITKEQGIEAAEMKKTVKPVKVSPLIKGARWGLLVCGIVYGTVKLRSLIMIESRLKPRREKIYKEEKDEKLRLVKISDRASIKELAEEFGITDLPPDSDEI